MSEAIRIGGVALDGRPRVALALRDTDDPAAVREAVDAGVDILELRVDLFQQADAAYGRGVLGLYGFAPRLLTIRSAAEGGGWRTDEAARAALFEALLPHCEAVDIELSAGAIRDRVIASAHGAGLPVVGSFHDFEATPGDAQLARLADAARDCGADALKVAATCRTAEDLRRLARFTLATEAVPVIVIGMGLHGTVSRVCFPALGSRLTYTFLGEATAPGQLNCGDTLKYLMRMYPAMGEGTGEKGK